MGDVENLLSVASGSADLGLTTPQSAGLMARMGGGPFNEKFEAIRGIAVLPHDDYFVWAVDARRGIKRFTEIGEKRAGLKIATGRIGPTGPDLRAFTVARVLEGYGVSQEALSSWGGGLQAVGEPGLAISQVISGGADAVFHEAQFLPKWNELANSREISFLALDEQVVEGICKKYGFDRRIIPKGRYRGVDRDLLSLDYSGFLLFTTSKIAERTIYKVTEALVKSLPRIDEEYQSKGPDLMAYVPPISATAICRGLKVPLHMGAEALYKDKGLLQ